MDNVKPLIDAINEACWYLPKKERDRIIEYCYGENFDFDNSELIRFLEVKFKCKIVR